METELEQDGKLQSTKIHQRIGRGLELAIENKDAKNLLYYFYKREVEKRKREFIFTDELKGSISQVGDFLTIETSFYGLFMPGSIGNGKTTMLKAIRDLLVYLVKNDKISYCEGDKYPHFVKARDIANMIIEDRDEFRIIKNTKFLLIDDLGAEPTEVIAYGMPYKPFDELLDYRYEQMLPTIISSNLTATDIEQKYDDPRIVDRMHEMFQILSFEEVSFR